MDSPESVSSRKVSERKLLTTKLRALSGSFICNTFLPTNKEFGDVLASGFSVLQLVLYDPKFF